MTSYCDSTCFDIDNFTNFIQLIVEVSMSEPNWPKWTVSIIIQYFDFIFLTDEKGVQCEFL